MYFILLQYYSLYFHVSFTSPPKLMQTLNNIKQKLPGTNNLNFSITLQAILKGIRVELSDMAFLILYQH